MADGARLDHQNSSISSSLERCYRTIEIDRLNGILPEDCGQAVPHKPLPRPLDVLHAGEVGGLDMGVVLAVVGGVGRTARGAGGQTAGDLRRQ